MALDVDIRHIEEQSKQWHLLEHRLHNDRTWNSINFVSMYLHKD